MVAGLSTLSDREDALAAGLRAGDAGAMDQLYRDYAERVLAWCIRLGAPKADAEDAAHEVFIVALRGGFRGESAVSTWLFQITRRVLANQRRRLAFRQFFGLHIGPEPVADERSDRALQRAQMQRQVREALNQLTELQREALVLVDFDQLSPSEAAAILGIDPNTLTQRLYTARRRFAQVAQGLRPLLVEVR